MPALSSDYLPKVGARDLIKILRFAVSRGLFYQLAGDTGVGKTEIMFQACSTVTPDMLSHHPSTALGYAPTGVSVLYIMCSNYDEWTLRGVQSFKDQVIDDQMETVTVTALPEWFRAYKELRLKFPNHVIVIILDEIAVGVMQMQASLLQLITQKAINEQEIPDDEKPLVSFMSAFNRPEDYPAAYNMTAPLAMRPHGALVFEPNVSDWFDYMDSRALMHPMVYDTLTKHPEYFHIKDIEDPRADSVDSYGNVDQRPRIATMNCVKPRNWTQICELCHTFFKDKELFDLEESDLHKMLSGRVPKEVATVLMASLKVVEELTDIKEIVADPDKARINPNMLMQTLQLYNLLGQVDANNIDSVIVYLTRMNETVKGIITTKVLAAKRAGTKTNLSSKVVSKLLTSFLGQSINNQAKLRGGATNEEVNKRMTERSDRAIENARLNVNKEDDDGAVDPNLEIEI